MPRMFTENYNAKFITFVVLLGFPRPAEMWSEKSVFETWHDVVVSECLPSVCHEVWDSQQTNLQSEFCSESFPKGKRHILDVETKLTNTIVSEHHLHAESVDALCGLEMLPCPSTKFLQLFLHKLGNHKMLYVLQLCWANTNSLPMWMNHLRGARHQDVS